MGGELKEHPKLKYLDSVTFSNFSVIYVDDLKYHTSWEHLMPVVRKILGKPYKESEPNKKPIFTIFDGNSGVMVQIDNRSEIGHSDVFITAIWQSVVKFISNK